MRQTGKNNFDVDVEHHKFNQDRINVVPKTNNIMEKKKFEPSIYIGKYNSTNDFVNAFKLQDAAKKVLGEDWEPEFDAEQIQNLLEFLHPNRYLVSVIPNVEEDDILISYNSPEDLLERIEYLEKELSKYQSLNKK